MTTNLKPGQQIRVTITAEPRRERDIDTLQRLMRMDPEAKRLLKKAQRFRMQTLVVRSRGKRPWEVRRPSAKLVRAEKGASWIMPYFPHIAPELNAVGRFLEVKPA